MKQKKNLWVNLLFAAVVLVIAGVAFFTSAVPGRAAAPWGAELISAMQTRCRRSLWTRMPSMTSTPAI